MINGAENTGIAPVVLEHDNRWEGEVSFMLERIGKNQKVEFLLYKQGQTEVYQPLHLWVNVTQ